MEFVRQHARKTRRVAPDMQAVPVAKKDDGKVHGKLIFSVIKAAHEERTVTGAVLVPDKVDSHGDLIPMDVIRKTALDFGFRLNDAPPAEETAKAGVQHTDFTKTDVIRVVENYLAPVTFDMDGVEIPEGTWVVTMKVLDDATWEKVKSGEITGFSVAGMAEVERTDLGKQIEEAAEKNEVPYIVAARAFVEQERAGQNAAATVGSQEAA